MAWGWVVRGLVGIVGSWWLIDDAIHALFASAAKRFMRDCCGFVNLRIWGGVLAPPIGAGSAGHYWAVVVEEPHWTNLLQICGR